MLPKRSCRQLVTITKYCMLACGKGSRRILKLRRKSYRRNSKSLSQDLKKSPVSITVESASSRHNSEPYSRSMWRMTWCVGTIQAFAGCRQEQLPSAWVNGIIFYRTTSWQLYRGDQSPQSSHGNLDWQGQISKCHTVQSAGSRRKVRRRIQPQQQVRTLEASLLEADQWWRQLTKNRRRPWQRLRWQSWR